MIKQLFVELEVPTIGPNTSNAQDTLVENMAKKNRSHYPIAVLLTTMLCNR